MRRSVNTVSAIICAFAVLMADAADIYAAKQSESQTADKTIQISLDEDDADETKEEEVKEEETDIAGEDGASEKSDNLLIERPDITEMTEVRIGTYEQWCDFACSCSLDTWSKDKYVILTDNIDFNMQKFEPVPLFSGVFDGQGYTINRAAYTIEQNYIGIFSRTAPTAVIRNLNVIGVMKPEGKPFDIGGIVGENEGMIANCKFDGYVEGYDYIGGIAGYNEPTGIISACTSTGKITGLHYVGGICGANSGLVTGCTAAADVNTVTKEVETGIQDIKVEEMFTSLLNIGREEGNKKSIASSDVPVDIGGICGHNTGEISSCTNDSVAGYEHVGYNIGGIAGRSAGYVHDCTNNGRLRGRKDVGGIVGQAEPYIRLDLSKDIIAQLNKGINSLHDSIERTIKDTGNSSGVVAARLNVIKGFADRALSDTGYLANSTEDYVNNVVGATNEIMGRIEYVIDESAKKDGPVDNIAQSGSNLKDAAEDISQMAEDLDIYNYMDDEEKTRYDAAKQNLRNATDEYSKYYKETYDDKYDEFYRKKYYELLTGTAMLTTPTDEQIEEAEEAAKESGKTDDDLEEYRDTASGYAAEKANIEAKAVADAKYFANHGSSYADDVKDYTETIANTILNHADEMADDAEEDGKAAAQNVKKLAGNLKDAGKQMKDIIGDIASRDPVRFPQLSEEYRFRTNSLVSNIQGMSDNLGYLNSEMKGSTDIVCNDLEDVNDDFSSIMLLFTDAMDGALDMDYSDVFEDESNDVCETSVDATIANCANSGKVSGDLDTGGITGTMAEEYDFDLEGDLTGVKDSARNSTYRTKCVIRDNVNRGEIRGKKSYVGGACGLHEIGTILRCANYAKVSSESGDYVGGIAGKSYATIKDSREKGVLAGGSYIGGICGNGVEIRDSIAMPTITEGTNFCGAIAGYADDSATLKNNVFTSGELAGIDRVSKEGAAEPVSYTQLMSMEGIPADFSFFKVSFIVDDETVSSITKREGETVTAEEAVVETLPDDGESDREDGIVDLADDEYIEWEINNEVPVHADMEVKGEIVRYASSIASTQVRENKQSVFLVEGKFLRSSELVVTQSPARSDGSEEYVLTIPDDGSAEHVIRYQMPEDVKNVNIMVESGGTFEEAETGSYGRYLTFPAVGSEVVVKIIPEDDTRFPVKYCCIGAAALAAVLILAVILIRKKRKKKSA